MRLIRLLLVRAILIAMIGLLWQQTACAQDRAASVLKRLDKNGDGLISPDEWPKPPKTFKIIDANTDGFLSIDELQARFANMGDDFGPGSPTNTADSPADGLYFVDAHSQMDGYVDEDRILSLMERGGVHRTILSAQKGRTWQSVADFARRKPDHITAAALIKGGGYHGGGEPRGEYLDRLKSQAADLAIGAMAEVLIYHDGMGRYYNIKVSLKDELVQAALNVARQREWPFILHIEFAGLSVTDRTDYLRQLEELLDEYPQHPFVLIHMGLLEEPEVRRLLARHSNLYFTTSATSNMFSKTKDGTTPKPFVNIFEGPAFRREWRQLFIDYPGQFLFALDCANNMHWMETPYLSQMRRWWSAMGTLPPKVATAVAHDNAERLWKLPPRREGGMLPPDAALKKFGPVMGNSANRPL